MYSLKKQKPLTQYPLLTQILYQSGKALKARPEIIDKKTGFLIKLTLGGKSKFFGLGKIPNFPLQDAVSYQLMRDKAFSYLLLEKAKIKVPKGNYFFKEEIKTALSFAKKLNYPVFLKPNSKSQGQFCQQVYSAKGLRIKLKEIFKIDRVALIQKPIKNKEYRIVVLDNQILLAYQKKPPQIIGDGKSAIRQLISKKNKKGRKVIKIDKIVKERLRQLNLTLKSVLPKGRLVFLRDNSNLATGGEIVQEVKLAGEKNKKIIKKISQIFEARFFALDLMAEEINQPKNWIILELNGNPSLEEFYQTHPQKTLEIYKKIIRACFK